MIFVLPHVEGLRPRWQIRIGLFLYDHIGGRKVLPASRGVRLTTPRYESLRPGFTHGFAYSDCWVDDSRLVVLNAMDAAARGASIRTRTRFAFGAREAKAAGMRCARTAAAGQRLEIQARAIVNAARAVGRGRAAPSAARARGRPGAAGQGQPHRRAQLFDGEHAFMLQNPDGRIVFAIPYERDYTLVGTTDVPFDGDPARVDISAEEIGYLCDTDLALLPPCSHSGATCAGATRAYARCRTTSLRTSRE